MISRETEPTVPLRVGDTAGARIATGKNVRGLAEAAARNSGNNRGTSKGRKRPNSSQTVLQLLPSKPLCAMNFH